MENNTEPKSLCATWTIDDTKNDDNLLMDGGWFTANTVNEIDAEVINSILEAAGHKSGKAVHDFKYGAINVFLQNPFTLEFNEGIVVYDDTVVRSYSIKLAGSIDVNDYMDVIEVKPNEIIMYKEQITVGSKTTIREETPKFSISKSFDSEAYVEYFNKILVSIEDKTGMPVGVLFNDKVSYISP